MRPPGRRHSVTMLDADAAETKSARRRRKKKQQEADAEDSKINEVGDELADMALKQQQIQEAFDRYSELQKQLDTLSGRTANTPRGHTMLYDRKKKLIDEMERLLQTAKSLGEATPGAGSVDGLKALGEKFSAAVISGEGGVAAGLEDQLSAMQAESVRRRQRAQELAAQARARRLAAGSGDGQ